MNRKWKRMLALTASLAMGSMTLLHFPAGTFEIRLSAMAAEGDVVINETNFPDENFRPYVAELDTTADGILSAEEIKAVKKISVSKKEISDLTGIEHFTALQELYCADNQLTYLDVSRNTELIILYCPNNQLTHLDLSKNTALRTLECSKNQLTSLDVSNTIDMESIDLNGNPLLALNGVSGDTYVGCATLIAAQLPIYSLTLADYGIVEEKVSALSGGSISNGVLKPNNGVYLVTYDYDCGVTTMSCSVQFGISVNEAQFPDENFRTYVKDSLDTTGDGILSKIEITEVTEINVSGKGISDLTGIELFTELSTLKCNSNGLTSLNVSGNEQLSHLQCNDNQLTTLDVSRNAALRALECDNNQLTSLDVSKNAALRALACRKNQLTSLDVSGNEALMSLYCDNNQLTSLDVSGKIGLNSLSCYDNRLTSLDVSGCPSLTTLSCRGNLLKKLNLTENEKLQELTCGGNQLNSLALEMNPELRLLDCSGNPLLSVNTAEVDSMLFSATDMTAYPADSMMLRLADFGIFSEGMSALTGCQLSTDEKYLLLTGEDGKAGYTYAVDSENSLTVSIAFPANGIAIDAAHFPDAAFCTYVGTEYDTNGDGALSAAEMAAVTEMDLSAAGLTTVTDLTGVEYFMALTTLNCSGNQLLSLDLTKNKALTTVTCTPNHTCTVSSESVKLSDYHITETSVRNLEGAEIVNGAIVPSSVPSVVTYDYACGSGRTISCAIAFPLPVDAVRFPDDVFRSYVKTNFDQNADNYLTAAEIAAVKKIEFSLAGITTVTDLTGVEYFTELTDLNCSSNALTNLDVSQNTKLSNLNCSSNALTKLDVSQNTVLTSLQCTGNRLTSLDVSKCSRLIQLNCSMNQLTSLNVSGCSSMFFLNCQNNQLTSFDVSTCTSLKSLECAANQLTSLDVSACTALNTLSCYKNQLTTLDVSTCTALNTLSCYENQLTSLDVSACPALNTLSCYENQLTSLDVSACPALNTLSCYENQLTSLDVSACPALNTLSCHGNTLLSLNGIGSELTELNAAPNAAFATAEGSVKLSDYGIEAANVLTLTGGEIKDGAIVPTAAPAAVTYTYNCGNSQTISFEIQFGVPIDEAHFPDAVFCSYVDETFDTTDDNILFAEEAAIESIDVSGKGITNLTGLAYFKNLSRLNCSDNQLTGLDLSRNTALQILDCTSCQLTGLDLRQNTELQSLTLIDNQLTELDLSQNTALKTLYCAGNQLTELDLSLNTALENLACSDNDLTELDVRSNAGLTQLNCANNQLKELDVRSNVGLTQLDCYNNQLTELDLSQNTVLDYLACSDNQLTALDLSRNTALTELECSGNRNNIVLEGGRFSLDNMPEGFDREKVTEWINVKEIGDVLTISDPFAPISYVYDCGSGKTAVFTLVAQSKILTEEMVFVEEQVYTGEACTPVTLYFGDYMLIEGSDYFISYVDNVNAGTASATITGWGSFEGNVTFEFDIAKKPIDSVTVDITEPEVNAFPQSDNIIGDGYTGLIDWEPAELHFSYDTVYTATVILMPDSNHLFTADMEAEGFSVTMNADGTVILTKEFAPTARAKITEMNAPEEKIEVLYCPKLEDALDLLPTEIEIEAEDGTGVLPVTWEIEGTYDAAVNAENTFRWTADIGDLDAGTFKTTGITKVVNLEYVVINEENFPDPTFRDYVNEKFDTTDDDVLTADEIALITLIDAEDMYITDLTGIEYFTNLVYLYCSKNQLTSLDVSRNTALETLYCSQNLLTSLDVSWNTALETLDCSQNLLTSLDVSRNMALTKLNCSTNSLTSLDVSQNTALTVLDCDFNQLTSLDVSRNTALTELNCSTNSLTSLDVSRNTALETLDCSQNLLTSLDVSQNTALTMLYCFANQLTGLDVSQNTALTTLYCLDNQLTGLDVSQNTALETLDCSQNLLTSLDVSQNTALIDLICEANYHPIDLIGDTFDLTKMPETFDFARVSGWQNAVIEGDTLTVLSWMENINYEYDCGNGHIMLFKLEIASIALTEDMVSDIENQVYTGSGLEPTIQVTLKDETLIQDVDYTVSYENNLSAGTAAVTIKGAGLFTGEIRKTFVIEPMPISNAEIILGDAPIYNGEEQKMPVKMMLDGAYLTSDHYTISGNTAANAGSYTLTITGIGDFGGEVNVNWEIKKATPAVTPFLADGIYTEGDALPEILCESDISGEIAWTTELTQLAAGENVLEWQFTPNDMDNYTIVEGTMVVEAQTATTTSETTTTTETTTTSTTETTDTTESTDVTSTTETTDTTESTDTTSTTETTDTTESTDATSTTETTDTTTETTETTTGSDLPQTGFSVIYNYIMLAAAAMVLFGAYAMAKSRRDEENE